LDPITRKPSHIAGVPPDYFSATGQRWGNPLYRWNDPDASIENQLYDWWAKRLRATFSQVDAVRIDHFRGFESYWRIRAEEKTAINGTWVKGPGLNFFREMEKRVGKLPIIAEDLGIITPEVEELRDTLEFPGMKILLFAFDGHVENPYLPYNHIQNCVVYTGTHDNDTVLGWYMSPEVAEDEKKRARAHANRADSQSTAINDDFIHLALSSPARLSILPLQDILGFGNDCRMNTPSTMGNNWSWRCAPRFLSSANGARLRERTEFFGRLQHIKFPSNNQDEDLDASPASQL
ncbi:MAG: 4-alpha-glucanotransferase, partial [Desulfobulbaceae bacterium]|nr:4-alpha-glucanotransferase [Desulfobulbaceae bacterium]